MWHAALVNKLRTAVVNGALLSLLSDYLNDRHLRVTVGGRESEVQPVKAGVPQGSCLGPVLWNLYINNLLDLLPSARAYPDDLTLTHSFATGEESVAVSMLSNTLNHITVWDRAWQMRCSLTGKTFQLQQRSSTPLHPHPSPRPRALRGSLSVTVAELQL
ncbi:hypothetical protein O3P69_014042 [Scylla paramamosain]|uniref:Reverse transcriptase domain-containing protein n=1 Tax=Scylla paramamosain TaxID=85552 RepID=A0AAW0SR41_SCYPA